VNDRGFATAGVAATVPVAATIVVLLSDVPQISSRLSVGSWPTMSIASVSTAWR